MEKMEQGREERKREKKVTQSTKLEIILIISILKRLYL